MKRNQFLSKMSSSQNPWHIGFRLALPFQNSRNFGSMNATAVTDLSLLALVHRSQHGGNARTIPDTNTNSVSENGCGITKGTARPAVTAVRSACVRRKHNLNLNLRSLKIGSQTSRAATITVPARFGGDARQTQTTYGAHALEDRVSARYARRDNDP